MVGFELASAMLDFARCTTTALIHLHLLGRTVELKSKVMCLMFFERRMAAHRALHLHQHR